MRKRTVWRLPCEKLPRSRRLLEDLAKQGYRQHMQNLPQTYEDFFYEKVMIGTEKLEKYGDQIIAIVKEHCENEKKESKTYKSFWVCSLCLFS